MEVVRSKRLFYLGQSIVWYPPGKAKGPATWDWPQRPSLVDGDKDRLG